MDKFESLILDSQVSAVILANLQAWDFEIVSLLDADTSPEVTAARRARGLGFLGVMALKQGGDFGCALATELPDSTIRILADSFARYVVATLTAPAADTTDWLERLHSLQDPRVENDLPRNRTEEN